MTTFYATDERFLLHNNGRGHPERPERLEAVWQAVRESGLEERVTSLDFAAAPDRVLLACHTVGHLALIRELCEQGGGQIDGDTGVVAQSYKVASLAVGAACAAVDAVMKEVGSNAFVAARPPGHHATPSHAMGFCLFNTVACAARYAQQQHGLERVAILDWDVHHGNGTQDIFYQDPTVLFVSLHQSPLYPYSGDSEETGSGAGKGFTFNVPLRAKQGDAEYLAVWREWVAPRVREFKPQLILLSAGYDAHVRDPLGGMNVTTQGFAQLAREAKAWATELCDGRLVAVLEGGYDLQGLGESAAATLEVFLEL